ncbi:GNAT family N-acetyltransferase [Massilia endophytica]|uniref:GNAT family N-acetyltransferase n=1 Tax=Massilia endophytica TaxID=2899220 RepID=UPI001E4DA536|nr:GNAT family N-acetyltransferase [Massilia endophytica]UGQ48215.1 GNAT family N-acetyltransferase [Massilia endophytica]
MLALELDYLQLRPAQAADDTFLKALYASTRDDLSLAAATPDMLALLLDLQWRAQSGGYRQTYPDADSLIVEEDGMPLGRLLVDCSASPWRIVDIALLPAARGRGHGAALLGALQAKARAAGAALALSVRRDNPAARRLYDSLGFVPAGGDMLAEQMVWPAP